MKRLTKRKDNGPAYIPQDDPHIHAFPIVPREALERFADIEDILGDDYGLDRLRELVEADREERTVLLLCKPGQTVFAVSKSRVVPCEVEEVDVDLRNGSCYYITFNCEHKCKGCPFAEWHKNRNGEKECRHEYGGAEVEEKDFRKTWFLTREEAEAALEAST